MPAQELQPCAKCGISGIHACLGKKQKKMSKRKEAEFNQIIVTVVKSIKAKQQGSE